MDKQTNPPSPAETKTAATAASANAARRGPPMPAFMFKIMNPLMRALLNSPLHSGMSKDLMVLTFTGRKTGRQFSTPVGYAREGNHLCVLTHVGWWKNFRGGAPVSVRLQGQTLRGTARIVDSPEAIKSMVRSLIAAKGEVRARQLGYWTDDVNAPADKIAADVRGTVFIDIELADAAR